MIVEKICTPLLDHYSYMIASEGDAFVLDPRRDVDVYLKLARKHNVVIKGVFETHRNEDIVTGGPLLAELADAPLYRSAHDDLPYETGTLIEDGDSFTCGQLTLRVLHTPGHTLGHLSYVVSERDADIFLFSGDCLFFGDAGRTDFYGQDKLEEMTRKLYHSLHDVYGALDDGVVLMPAHGPGSACGSSIEDRPYSTLGFERKTNKLLQATEDEFVKMHGYMRLKPHYFNTVEEYNLRGPADPLFFDGYTYVGHPAVDIDCRDQAAYLGLHEKNVLHINHAEFSSYLGWFVNVGSPLHLITDYLPEETVDDLFWTARRMAYDGPIYHSRDGYQSDLQNADKEVVQTAFIQVQDLDKDALILDVRKQDELDKDDYKDVFTNRVHIPLQVLDQHLDDLDPSKHYHILCTSGIRATIASSLLEKAGCDCSVILGGMNAVEASGREWR